MRRVYAASVVLLMILSVLPLSQTVLSASPTPSAPAQLSLSLAPSVLPADGGTYPAVYVSLLDGSGLPTLALSNVTVYLAVSDLDIGTLLNQTVVIHAGRNYATADFKTTGVAGSATISASATGLQPAQTKLTTSIPIGYPTQIVLSTVPSNVPSLPSYSGKVVVELEDQAGLPAKSVSDTTVQLSSSNTNIVNVDSYVVVRAGQYTAIAGYVSGPVPGTAIITAISPGYGSGSTSLTVTGPTALALHLYALPSSTVACVAPVSPTYCNGLLVVAITDLSGAPVHAPSPVTVQVRSSNTTIVNTAALQITIPRGNSSSVIRYYTTSFTGTATITVSAPGLSSSYATVTTVRPGGTPVGLQVSTAPDSIPADHCTCGYAVVSLVDASGSPTVDTVFSTNDNVVLTSSQAFIANFSNKLASIFLQIPADSNYISTSVTSTFVPGSTSLTASAQNRAHAVASITTTGPVPSRIAIKPLFAPAGSTGQLPADGALHPAFEVGLEDVSGNPVPAPSTTAIFINSSNSQVLQVSSPLLIPTGKSSVLLNATTSLLAGSSNITASVTINGQRHSSSSLVSTLTPAPSRVVTFLQPSELLLSPLKPQATLYIQLQDSGGNPARARADIPLTITSSNTEVINRTLSVTIPQGADYVTVPLNPLSAGTTVLTILSPGLATGGAQFTVLPSPFSSQLLASSLVILSNQTATLTFTATLDGQGLQGVRVSWLARNGNISPSSSTTGPSGQTSAVFTPASAGLGKIYAIVYSPAIGSENLSSVISVVQAMPPKTQTLLQKLLTFPYILIPVITAAIVVVLSVILIRRKTRKLAPEGEEGAEETQADFMYLGRDQSVSLTWTGTSA
jgi:hypothetical protein